MLKNNWNSVVIFIIFFILVLLSSMFFFGDNIDLLWNYGYSNAIATGEVIYKDFNIVLFPFYPIFMSTFLHIYNNILTINIINSIYITVAVLLIIKLLGKKGYLFMIFLLIFPIFLYATYNSFLFFLLILLIYLEKKEFKYKDFIIGLLLSISFLTKQSVGIFFIIPSLINVKKINIKKRTIGFIIPILITIIYLLISKSLYNFIDLCILGLFDFTGNTKGFNGTIIIFIVILLITIYYILKQKKIDYIYIFMFYSMFFPIFNISHLLSIIIPFLYIIIDQIPKKDFIDYKLFSITISIIIFIVLSKCLIPKDFDYPNSINKYKYLIISKEKEKYYNDVSKYINKNNVYIYDYDAIMFRTINSKKISYKDYPITGNIGYNGSKKIINLIKKNKDEKFLVKTNEEMKTSIEKGYTQLDKKGYYYIINNGTKIGEISSFDIYSFE